MTSIAQISENEQREIEGTLKKFCADYKVTQTSHMNNTDNTLKIL